MRKSKNINIEAFNQMIEKHALINKLIEEGKEIPKELIKNFVSFPLSEDPYSDISKSDNF